MTSFPNYGTAAKLVQLASLGTAPDEHHETLVGLGFGEVVDGEFQLTEAGNAFDDAANVYRNTDEGMELLRRAYLSVPAVQVLTQGLHGRGAVNADGAHYLVARHKLFDPNDREAFGRLLTVLNEIRVIAYSKKHSSVRLLIPIADEESDQPVAVRVVEPDRPFTNRRHLRETLRECKGYLWWADPHFDKIALEPLSDEIDGGDVNEIRILTSSMPPPAEIAGHYKPFIVEMTGRGVTVEIRVVNASDAEWHDRFIFAKNAAWNVPPTNTVMKKGKYSEITKTDTRPPFDDWWAKGTPLF